MVPRLFSWLSHRPSLPPRLALLSAIPVRNSLARENIPPSAPPNPPSASQNTPFAPQNPSPARQHPGLTLIVPTHHRPTTRALQRLTRPASASHPPQKAFQLDDLGAFVWHAIDGHRTVESLIRHFGEQHRVNLREAEVAVLAFLRTLTQRGLIALVAPKPDSEKGLQ